jgi:hypothetical protein
MSRNVVSGVLVRCRACLFPRKCVKHGRAVSLDLGSTAELLDIKLAKQVEHSPITSRVILQVASSDRTNMLIIVMLSCITSIGFS